VYLCLYPKSRGGAGREGVIFLLAAGAALILVLVILPAGFVSNTVIENLRPDRIEEIIKPSESGIPRQSERRNGRDTIPSGRNGQPGLRGISEENWPGTGGRGSGASRQYTVMVAASKYEPVYMGSSFLGKLDPVEGFLQSANEPLNRLSKERFFTTWSDNERNYDRGRKRYEVFSLSTLPDNFLPYRPYAIDPTILSEGTGPLRYLHRVFSNVNTSDSLELVNIRLRDLSESEKNSLSHYLEIPLSETDKDIFSEILNRALFRWEENRRDIISGNQYLGYIFSKAPNPGIPNNEYLEKIIAISTFFSDYYYYLDSSGISTISWLKTFLLETKEGNCVEFSNSLALLGRLAGIPSRVVTGYIVSENLQTSAHLRGLAALRSSIPVLQEFPFDDLYLVTNVHSHSWTQFYIPEYGWLDFEGTMFAIPPVGSADFNTWDVVIPLMNENKVIRQVRKFPWQAFFRSVIVIAVFCLLCAYIIRYSREAILSWYVSRGGRAGARSLYLLLLARLASDGKPIKPVSKTALEYADLFPGTSEDSSSFTAFAKLYTEIRWREFGDNTERDQCFIMLKKEYKNILKTNLRRGVLGFLIRIFSLRGLLYL
jgi:hypothetical protein